MMHPDFLKRHQPAPPPESTRRTEWSEAVPLAKAPKPVREKQVTRTRGVRQTGPCPQYTKATCPEHHWVKNGFSKEGKQRRRCMLCPASETL